MNHDFQPSQCKILIEKSCSHSALNDLYVTYRLSITVSLQPLLPPSKKTRLNEYIFILYMYIKSMLKKSNIRYMQLSPLNYSLLSRKNTITIATNRKYKSSRKLSAYIYASNVR